MQSAAISKFEDVLFRRAGGCPSDANYDPELLDAGAALIEETKALRAALEKYASKGFWSGGNSGVCYTGREVAAKALGQA